MAWKNRKIHDPNWKPADNHPFRMSNRKKSQLSTAKELAEKLEDEELDERLESVNGAPFWVDEV